MGNYDKMYEEIAEERMAEISRIIAKGGRIPKEVNDERVYKLEVRCEKLEKELAEIRSLFDEMKTQIETDRCVVVKKK